MQQGTRLSCFVECKDAKEWNMAETYSKCS